MTNLCDVCGKPATQSMLRDLFGKSDEMRFVCSDHGFRIRDPADAAAIEQLHAAVKTAQELAATRLMEIERLRGQLNFANREPPHCPSCNCGSPEPLQQRCDCWERISALIVKGPLEGDGWDPTAQRNGIILAANHIAPFNRPAQGASRSEQPVATPGATLTGEDSVRQPAESSRPRELLSQGASRDASSKPCECLILDKEPSAYHWSNCPRYVAGKL